VDYTSLVRSLFESEDWQPLIDHLAEDVVFKATIPDGTPISGEFRGKQAVVDHLVRLGDILEFRQERPREFFGNGERVVFLGTESVEIKKSGITVPESEYATVLDVHDGLITRFGGFFDGILLHQILQAVAHSGAGRLPADHRTVHAAVRARRTCALVGSAARSCDRRRETGPT
jgi:ketosteroid isomerase-like protein